MNIQRLKEYCFITDFSIESDAEGMITMELVLHNLKTNQNEVRSYRMQYTDCCSMTVQNTFDSNGNSAENIYNFRKYIKYIQNIADGLFLNIQHWNGSRSYLVSKNNDELQIRHSEEVMDTMERLDEKYGIDLSFLSDYVTISPIFAKNAASVSYSAEHGTILRTDDGYPHVPTSIKMMFMRIPGYHRKFWATQLLDSLNATTERGDRFAHAIYEDSSDFIRNMLHENDSEDYSLINEYPLIYLF